MWQRIKTLWWMSGLDLLSIDKKDRKKAREQLQEGYFKFLDRKMATIIDTHKEEIFPDHETDIN